MSCLFNSLEKLLGKENIRIEICKYIEDNLDKKIADEKIKLWIEYSASDMKISLDEYIKRMKLSSTMGGGPELMIASKIYNIKIIVKKDSKNIEFNCADNPTKILYLDYSGKSLFT